MPGFVDPETLTPSDEGGHYDRAASDYDAGLKWPSGFPGTGRRSRDDRSADARPGHHILEVGCGFGATRHIIRAGFSRAARSCQDLSAGARRAHGPAAAPIARVPFERRVVFLPFADGSRRAHFGGLKPSGKAARSGSRRASRKGRSSSATSQNQGCAGNSSAARSCMPTRSTVISARVARKRQRVLLISWRSRRRRPPP